MLRLIVVSFAVIGATAFAAQPIGWEVRSDGSRTVASPEVFGAAALSWSAAGPAAVRVRTSPDGGTWSEWIHAPLDHHLADAGASRYFTSIVQAPSFSRYLQYAFTAADAVPHDVVVTFFGLPGPRDPIASASLMLGNLPIRSRLEWGCPDGTGSRWTPAYTNVTHAVVHHTAGSNTVIDWENEVRNIWYFHTVTRGWGDIGYNYLIDPNGVIYEGRAGGLGAIGAHFSCRNSNTVGVSLLGTFTSQLPTQTALDSLTRLLVELAKAHRIDGDAFVYHAPTQLNLPAIPGHRDANASPQACSTTECPGNALYAQLPVIRTDVAHCPPVITSGPVSVVIATGRSATLTVTATSSETLSYQWYAGISGDASAPVNGATGPTLTVAPGTRTHYWVRATTRCGTADSDTAVVIVGSSSRRRGTRR